MPTGTLVNVLTVVLGGALGLLLNRRLPEKYRTVVFQGIGLIILALGARMALAAENILPAVISVLLGGLFGAALNLDGRINRLGDKLKARLQVRDPRFSEGLIAAFLVFCSGSPAILGALNEGLKDDHALLLTKAAMDGFVAIALAATYGAGVLFAAVPLGLYQLALTLTAGWSAPYFTTTVLEQFTVTGGILVLGLGLNLLELRVIVVNNLLPALLIVLLVAPWW